MTPPLWNWILVNPMTNALVLLNNVFFGSFGLAIIVFTVVMRAVTFPLTLRQLRSSRAMSAMSSRRCRRFRRSTKTRKRRQEETMKLYREAGVNPLGCLLPMVVQTADLVRALQRASTHRRRRAREHDKPLAAPLPLVVYPAGGAPEQQVPRA